jgi:hypothetical protein
VSFSLYFQSVPTGLFYMGAGLACIGLGLLFGIGVYLLARTMLRGMARLAARIRHGRASRRWKANARKAQQDAGQTVRPGAGLGQAMPQDAGWAMQDAGQAMPKDAGSVMPHDTGQTMPQDTGQAVPQIEKKEDGHA